MSELEILAIGRALLAVVILVFALRSRYWFLALAGGVGLLVSVLISVGVDPAWTARLAYGLYAAMAAHALDISRRKRPADHYLPRFEGRNEAP